MGLTILLDGFIAGPNDGRARGKTASVYFGQPMDVRKGST